MDSLRDTLMETLGIELGTIEKGKVSGRMPVDGRTRQPLGLLHGGASTAFAETLGSVGGQANIDESSQAVVCVEINANHVQSVREGWVHGIATPEHIGSRTQIWQVRIIDDKERLVCLSRLTLMTIDRC